MMVRWKIVLLIICVFVASPGKSETQVTDFLMGALRWNAKIVGGSGAVKGQFPYQVSLRNSGNTHFCGASIIHQSWVISAAHCSENRIAANILACVGSISRTTGGFAYRIAKIFIHPLYNKMDNDISLLQTHVPFTFSKNVLPIRLGSEFVEGNEDVLVSGWGHSEYPGTSLATLQYLSLKTLSLEDCRDMFNSVNAAKVLDNTICTFTRAGQGTCLGDSGSGLVDKTHIVGVVAWGIPCGKGLPDVYSRVSSHRPWIIRTIG